MLFSLDGKLKIKIPSPLKSTKLFCSNNRCFGIFSSKYNNHPIIIYDIHQEGKQVFQKVLK